MNVQPNGVIWFFLQQIVPGQLHSHMQKGWFRSLPHIMHEKHVKMDYRLKG